MAGAPDLVVGAATVSVRAAVAPLRVAAAMPLVGGPVRRVAGALEDEGRRARELVVGRALDGPLVEAIAQLIVEHHLVERVAREIAATADVAATVAEALDSALVVELTDRILASTEMQLVIERVASSPELRRAIAEQSSGLADDVVGGLRERGETLDESAERAVRGWFRRPRPQPL